VRGAFVVIEMVWVFFYCADSGLSTIVGTMVRLDLRPGIHIENLLLSLLSDVNGNARIIEVMDLLRLLNMRPQVER
jgi:hypothetical protein